MDEIYVNVQRAKPVNPRPPTNQTAPRSSERRFHGAVALCLGLLSVFLLAGLIGLGVYYSESVRGLAAELSTIKANQTERLQASDDKLSSLTAERDLLNASLTETTKELNRLQSLSKQKRTCPAGWRMLCDSCYLVSEESGSWDKGRKDCKDKGADLVVINSPEEQAFLWALAKKHSWIGLNDRDKEGTWKWADGSSLTLTYWEGNQPDNGGGDPQWGEEDCGHITSYSGWNDRSCESPLPWICEKTA